MARYATLREQRVRATLPAWRQRRQEAPGARPVCGNGVVALNVYYVQQLWFDSFHFPDTLTPHFLTIDLPNVNVKAYIALNALSLGVSSDNTGGIMAAGIRSYEYTDTSGFHHVDVPIALAHATVHKCSKITFGVQGRQAFGSAVGMLYWFIE
jgi:hypothetical protein